MIARLLPLVFLLGCYNDKPYDSADPCAWAAAAGEALGHDMGADCSQWYPIDPSYYPAEIIGDEELTACFQEGAQTAWEESYYDPANGCPPYEP